jgi:hypothetical protein
MRSIPFLLAVFGFVAACSVMVYSLPHTQPRRRPITGVSGTLIVVIPATDGLVIASDTRSTTAGAACDGNSKIALPTRPELSFVAASGTSSWIEARYPLWAHDPCGDLAKNGIVFFDSKKTVVEFIESAGKLISELDLKAVSDRLISEILAVNTKYSGYVQSFAGKQMFEIVVGQYDRVQRASTVRIFNLSLSTDLKIKADVVLDRTFTDNDPASVVMSGQVDDVHAYVLKPGGTYIPDSWTKLLALKTVGGVTSSRANNVAIDVIAAATKAAEIVPELRHGIGGPIDAYLINNDGRTKMQ